MKSKPTKRAVDKFDWDAIALVIMDLESELHVFGKLLSPKEIKEYQRLISMYESLKQKMIHQSPRQYQVLAPVDFLGTDRLDDGFEE